MEKIYYNGEVLQEVEQAGQVSDGYHTFDELYDHRCALFCALMDAERTLSWKSRRHADGSEWAGWFIAGMNLAGRPITYHLPDKYWDVAFGVKELERAPEWDGHSSKDVLERILAWVV